MPIIRDPGKFEGELHLCDVLWEITLNGGHDDEVGESETTGWYGLILDLSLTDALDVAKELGIPEKHIRDDFTDVGGDFHRGPVHAIVSENSLGFVSCEFYETGRGARKAFDKISKEIENEIEGEY